MQQPKEHGLPGGTIVDLVENGRRSRVVVQVERVPCWLLPSALRPIVSGAQFIGWLLSSCAHSMLISEYTETGCGTPSLLRAVVMMSESGILRCRGSLASTGERKING
jgi:hypothetical protein